ncbi:MAG: DinB family protein [Planctomycetota bacterium]
MNTSVDVIRDMHAHRIWARQKLLAAARGLDQARVTEDMNMGRGSLLFTIAHLLEAETVWIEALEGQSGRAVDDARYGSLDAVEQAWTATDARWTTYLDSLTEERLSAKIERFSGALQRTYVLLARDALVHVCTHQMYTAAQAANMIKRLGGAAPAMDFAWWAMEQQR